MIVTFYDLLSSVVVRDAIKKYIYIYVLIFFVMFYFLRVVCNESERYPLRDQIKTRCNVLAAFLNHNAILHFSSHDGCRMRALRTQSVQRTEHGYLVGAIK